MVLFHRLFTLIHYISSLLHDLLYFLFVFFICIVFIRVIVIYGIYSFILDTQSFTKCRSLTISICFYDIDKQLYHHT